MLCLSLHLEWPGSTDILIGWHFPGSKLLTARTRILDRYTSFRTWSVWDYDLKGFPFIASETYEESHGLFPMKNVAGGWRSHRISMETMITYVCCSRHPFKSDLLECRLKVQNHTFVKALPDQCHVRRSTHCVHSSSDHSNSAIIFNLEWEVLTSYAFKWIFRALYGSCSIQWLLSLCGRAFSTSTMLGGW